MKAKRTTTKPGYTDTLQIDVAFWEHQAKHLAGCADTLLAKSRANAELERQLRAIWSSAEGLNSAVHVLLEAMGNPGLPDIDQRVRYAQDQSTNFETRSDALHKFEKEHKP